MQELTIKQLKELIERNNKMLEQYLDYRKELKQSLVSLPPQDTRVRFETLKEVFICDREIQQLIWNIEDLEEELENR